MGAELSCGTRAQLLAPERGARKEGAPRPCLKNCERDFARAAAEASRQSHEMRPKSASQSRIAHIVARRSGFACVVRALRTRSIGGACPRRLSRGASRAFVPLRFALEGRSARRAALQSSKRKTPNREALEDTGKGPLVWIFRRRLGWPAAVPSAKLPIDRERPAIGGIDPNAKQVLHKDRKRRWQGFSGSVAPPPQP